MEGIDVTTVLDRDQRNKWSVFGALAGVCAVWSDVSRYLMHSYSLQPAY